MALHGEHKKKKDTRTEAEKEKARMVAKHRLAAYQKSLREPSKKKPVKEKESWVARLKRKVRKIFDAEKKTLATKDKERQLRRSLTKKDIERFQRKKKK